MITGDLDASPRLVGGSRLITPRDRIEQSLAFRGGGVIEAAVLGKNAACH